MNAVPVRTRGGWTSLPFDLVRAFRGNSRLPVYEIDKAKVQRKNGRVRPLGTANDEISFGAWRLAHALKKAECAREPSAALLAVGAAGFLLEHIHLFDWRGEELRLAAGMSDYYADFSRTGLAGRVAQGVALLLLEAQGYAYTARLSAEIKRHNGSKIAQGVLQSKAKKSRSTPSRAPDFLLENGRGERALAEAKGAFATPNERCDIKGSLKDALDQLEGWDRVLTPQPRKNFAIGTFLREADDLFEEPSLLAFVDPEPGQPEPPIEIQPDAIRRANYASWLALMGFADVAERLRTRAGEPQRRTVRLLRLGGRSYVVTLASIRPWSPSGRVDEDFWEFIDEWPYWFLEPFAGVCLEVIGLDLDIVHALGGTSGQPAATGLMSLEPQQREFPSEIDGGRFYGSVLSDGSLFGELRMSRHHRLRFDSEEIEL